jgi:DNA-binding response OmpR family regulator
VRLRLQEGKSAVDVRHAQKLLDGLMSLSNDAPSVVLLGLNLPDSHGAETFRKVMAIRRMCPS